MKLNALTSAITCALLAAPLAQAAETQTDFYGSLRIGIDSVDAGVDEDGANGRDYLSRVGVKASTDLGNGLTGVGQIEYGIRDDNSIDIQQNGQPTLRLALVGLKGSFGEVYYGSQTPLFHKYVRSAYFSDGNDTVRLGTVREDDLTQYYFKGDNYSVAAAIHTEGQDGDDLDSYSFAGEYKAGPVTLQAAYVKDERVGDGQLMGARAWYKVTDAVTLSAFYHLQDDDFGLYNGSTGNIRLVGGAPGIPNCAGQERSAQGIYASYQAGNGQIHGRYAVDSCEDDGDVSSAKVEYIHFLAKNYRLWVSYEALNNDDDRAPVSTSGDDMSETQLGVRYDF
ncbi:MAG: porin [Pseudomonadota bacterium]|nr:porin [Pseudomonadota bacterium]